MVEIALPPAFEGITGLRHRWMMNGEGRVNMLAEARVDPAGLSDDLHAHVENRHGITRKMQLQAYDEIAALRPVIDGIASQYDAIVTPSVPSEAPKGMKTGDARFNSMWTALHVPCVHVPGFASESGMPIGLTLVGPRSVFGYQHDTG